MSTTPGSKIKDAINQRGIFPIVGVYDVFSASLAAKHFDGIFISGFSFAASFYGLPDIGFIAWPDIVAFTQRMRAILPEAHIVVDIDDGYADIETACHVVSLLESVGASGVILEDQKRPRRCGHFNNKNVLELDEYLTKLNRVLKTRNTMMVVARTDASDEEEIVKRARAFDEAGADIVLADGIKNVSLLKQLNQAVEKPLAFNQIAGGKSPSLSLRELEELGVSLVIYSTPCLFAAQHAIDFSMKSLKEHDGVLDSESGQRITIKECNALLESNLRRRDSSKVKR